MIITTFTRTPVIISFKYDLFLKHQFKSCCMHSVARHHYVLFSQFLEHINPPPHVSFQQPLLSTR